MRILTAIFTLWMLLLAPAAFTQIAINDNGADPNTNTILDVDVSSNDKGIMIPRLTSENRDDMTLGILDEGLTVYDTDTKTYWLWDGSQWANFNSGSAHTVGEVYDGGIIFYVDGTGEHGYMASLYNLDGGSGAAWSNICNTAIGDSAQYMTYGSSNTTFIINQTGHTASAAKLCRDHNGGGHNDWYLPSIRELIMLISFDVIIDNTLAKDGDGSTNGLSNFDMMTGYWSSTENNGNTAWCFYPNMFSLAPQDKSNTLYVRAIRRF